MNLKNNKFKIHKRRISQPKLDKINSIKLTTIVFILFLFMGPYTSIVSNVLFKGIEEGSASEVDEPDIHTNSVSYSIFATRIGLVGQTTANGHIIQSNDRFVALPSSKVLCSNDGYEFQVRISYNGRSVTAPVWDIGPWNIQDDYWNPSQQREMWNDLPQGMPEAQAAYQNGYNSGKDQYDRTVSNPAGIDLADGTFWGDLGMIDNDWVTVEFLWVPSVSVRDSSPYFTKGSNSGHPEYWRSYSHDGHEYLWTYIGGMTNDPSQTDCWAEFKPYFSQAGTYEVYSCFYADPENSNKVPHTVYYDGGTATVNVNQYASSYFTWTRYKLGTWDFAAGASSRIIITDANGDAYDGTTLNADTIEFVLVSQPSNNKPNIPTLVGQYRSDGSTPIPEGGTTSEHTVVFQAFVSDPDGDDVILEIELRNINEPFYGVPTDETISNPYPSGSQASVTRYGLNPNGYKWQYRAKDSEGEVSDWVEFGTPGNTDFTVYIPTNNPPNIPLSPLQLKSDGVTQIPEGGTTSEHTVVFQAFVNDPDGDDVILEIELRSINEPFYGVPTGETISNTYPSGSQATVTRYGLDPNGYKWQYRAKDSKGEVSDWVEFETIGNIDFYVVENGLPSLSNGYVTPTSGEILTSYKFYVTYYGASFPSSIVYIDDYPYIMEMISGDYISGAIFQYTTNLRPGDHNFYFEFQDINGNTIKLPSTGYYQGPTVLSESPISYEWDRSWGEQDMKSGSAFTLDSFNNIYYVGTSRETYPENDDISLIKFNSQGIEQWSTSWGGSALEIGRAVTIDSLQNIYVAGDTESYGYGQLLTPDICLIKYNQFGEVIWSRIWGGEAHDYCTALVVDSDDNVYVAGQTRSFGEGGYDMFLLKYNSLGILQWQRIWGGQNWEDCYGMKIDSLNNIFLVGYTESYGMGAADICLVKFDPNGNELWYRTWGDHEIERGYDIALDSSNNIFITGTTYGEISGEFYSEMVLVKYNNLGIEQWYKTWRINKATEGYGIALDSLTNIYITGMTGGAAGSPSAFLIKYNSLGIEQWYKVKNGISLWGGGVEIAIDSLDNIYICGGSSGATSLIIIHTYGFDNYLLKYDNTGSLVWEFKWGGSSNEYGIDTAVDSENNVYVAGLTESYGSGGFDACLLKYESSGYLVWNSTWGTSKSESCYGIVIDSLDNIYLTGYTYDYEDSNYDMFLLKYDKFGNLIWSKIWGNSGMEIGMAVSVDSFDNIYVTGIFSEQSLYNSPIDAFILKYDSNGLIQWEKTFQRAQMTVPTSISLDTLNNIFITGMTAVDFYGSPDIFVAKFDNFGVELWYEEWGSENIYDFSYAIDIDSLNNVYIAGSTEQTEHNTGDMLLIKYDQLGTQQWVRTWGGIGSEVCITMKIDQYDDIYLAGPTNSFSPSTTETCIVKYDSSGDYKYCQLWNRGSFDYCLYYSINIDSFSNIYLAGYTNPLYSHDYDISLVKFSQGVYEPRSSSLFDGMFLDFTASGSFVDFDAARVSYSQLSENMFQATITSADYYAWYDVNKQTRIISNSGGNLYFMDGTHSIYWIFTDVKIGDYVPILVDGEGDHIFRIHGDRNYYLPGFGTVEVWELEDLNAPGAYAWYEKSTGVLMKGLFYYNDGNDYYEVELVDSNADFEIFDLNPPIIVINSPIAGEIFGGVSPSFDLVVTDESGIDLMWYTLDGGITNQAITELTGSINQELWDACAEGIVTIEFYAKDLAGNIGYAEVIVGKKINQPPTCILALQQAGSEIYEIDVGDYFEIYVGDSSDDNGIFQIQFMSDETQDGIPSGTWTSLYDWNNTLDEWNAQTKIKWWLFATGGAKEVWVRIIDKFGVITENYAHIYAIDVSLILTGALEFMPIKDFYYLGDTLTATFTIKNERNYPIILDLLTIGGRLNGWIPEEGAPDFTHDTVILAPYQEYLYEGTITLTKPGNYHFFIAYYIENPLPNEKELLDENNWNTCINLGEGLIHNSRIKNLFVLDEPITPDDFDELNAKINDKLSREPEYPPNFLEEQSFTGRVASIWASFTQWITHTNLIDKYEELYQAGKDYERLSYISILNASYSIKNGQISLAKEYLNNYYAFQKLSAMSFGAASEVFDDCLEAGEILAKGIRELCQAVLKGYLSVTGSPAMAEGADWIFFGIDLIVDVVLRGETEEAKDMFINQVLKFFFNVQKFDKLGSRTIKEFIQNRIGKFSCKLLHTLFIDILNNEEALFYAFKIIKESIYIYMFSPEVREWIIDKLLDILRSIAENIVKMSNFLIAHIYSPVEFRIYNSEGKFTGVLENKVFHGISRSEYFNNTITIFYPEESYRYKLKGLEQGSYGLEIENYENTTISVFIANNIPIFSNEIHQYIVDWYILSQDEDGIIIEIDTDGDGITDHSFNSDSNLNTAEYIIETLTWLYEDSALQDGVVFELETFDNTLINWITVSIREPGGEDGFFISDELENIPLIYDDELDIWESNNFDTTQLPDGYYVLFVQLCDTSEFTSTVTFDFSIRNWAALELLPATERNRAGRTMPVKFSLRVVEAVDPEMPFVWNEEMEIIIYDENNPDIILQHSIFGDTSKDYRISSESEHYITNFKTSKNPTTYIVEIWRKGMLIGAFEFETYKSKQNLGSNISTMLANFQLLQGLNLAFLLLGTTYLLIISRKKLIHL